MSLYKWYNMVYGEPVKFLEINIILIQNDRRDINCYHTHNFTWSTHGKLVRLNLENYSKSNYTYSSAKGYANYLSKSYDSITSVHYFIVTVYISK